MVIFGEGENKEIQTLVYCVVYCYCEGEEGGGEGWGAG